MIYLHVPFCESFCTYCGFYSVVCTPSPAYTDAVCKEIEERRDEIAQTLDVNTLYIGGGTPSVLPLDVLSRIVHTLEAAVTRPGRGYTAEPFALRASSRLACGEPPVHEATGGHRFGRHTPSGAGDSSWEEFTVEVNPEDIVEKGEEYVRGLLALGVNRISMGIQSFDDGILKWMNRRHDSATAVEAFRILRRCGVGNISIDLIFGLPQLSEELWSGTLGRALELEPEHISAYQLSIEEESALEKLIAQGKFTEAADEQCRRQYDILCQRLGEAGYHHYEISNFALPGREAVHNSAYWRRVPYVGLGPGAHSLSASSVRSWNSETLIGYSREEELLTPEDIRVERIMLPLRTDVGLLESELRSLAGDQVVDSLLAEGALVRIPANLPERSEGHIRIPEDHFFTSDDIIRDLI